MSVKFSVDINGSQLSLDVPGAEVVTADVDGDGKVDSVTIRIPEPASTLREIVKRVNAIGRLIK